MLRFGTAYHTCVELYYKKKPINVKAIAAANDISHDVERLNDYFVRGTKIADQMIKERGWDKHNKLIEQKMAYDPHVDKTRFLLAGPPRDYSGRKPSEFPGTVDLGLSKKVAGYGSSLITIDWKSGVSDYEAESNGQLASLSLAMSRHYGIDSAHAVMFRIDDEFVQLYEADYDADKLNSHRELLRKRLLAAISPTPVMRPGMHCVYCDCNEICPAQVGISALSEAVDMQDSDTFARVYAEMQTADQIVSKVRERLREYVRANGPQPLDNGKYAAMVKFEKEQISKAGITRTLGKLEGEMLIAALREKGVVEKVPEEQMRQVIDPSARK